MKKIILSVFLMTLIILSCQKETNNKTVSKNPKPIYSMGAYDWSMYFSSSYIEDNFGNESFIDSVESLINYDPRDLASNSLFLSWFNDFITIDSTLSTIAKNNPNGRIAFWSTYASELNSMENDLALFDTLSAYQHFENFSSLLVGQPKIILHFYTIDENQLTIDHQFSVIDASSGYNAIISSMVQKFQSLKMLEPFSTLNYSQIGLLLSTGLSYMMNGEGQGELSYCSQVFYKNFCNAIVAYNSDIDFCKGSVPLKDLQACTAHAENTCNESMSAALTAYSVCVNGIISYPNTPYSVGRLIAPRLDN